ncbi:aminodeoxychorismate/anthranilate synthase component II [Candidatus Vidania fulgoroideorum]
MIIIIDHNDSFTYNVCELFLNNNSIINIINYNNLNIIYLFVILFKPIICLGPGPGDPREYKNSIKVLSFFYNNISFVGICLGHQIIGIFFGMKIKISSVIAHGLIVELIIKNFYKKIKIPKKIKVVRYNSLTVFSDKIVNLKTEAYELNTKEIMIMKHNNFNIVSFQYHPDSFMSQYSKKILKFFLKK